jgi:hypothetical protein
MKHIVQKTLAMEPFITHKHFSNGLYAGFLFGLLSTLLFALIAGRLLRRPKRDVYDLDHWKLNVNVPFDSMWMNMGYW